MIQAELAREEARIEAAPLADRVDNWLREHLNFVALAIIAAGLGYRVYIASRNYLNPDEALHYQLINQRNVWLAYQASLTNAHPPLYYFILYYAHLIGRSELMLRMPSVIAGTAFCWLGFLWLKRILGAAAGTAGLVLFAFSPALVALSAEVRQYSVMLLCMASALYFLALAFEEKSVARMWCFSIFLFLAILSHYSVMFFALALGVYVLARILDSELPRSVVAAWVIGQVLALAEYGFLYVTHILKIRKSIPVWSLEFFFFSTYYDWSEGNILGYTWRKTLSVLTFLFAQKYVALFLLLCFSAGVAAILAKDILGRHKNISMNRLGLLLLVPFASIWGASLARIYPYVGDRHTVVLAPFAVAGISFLLASMTRQKLWAGLVLAGILVSFSNSAKGEMRLDPFAAGRSTAEMASVVDYMHTTIPVGDHVFMDYQSSLPATYYFCGPNEIVPVNTFEVKPYSSSSFYDFTCHGYPIVSTQGWKLNSVIFPWRFEEMVRAYGLKPGDRVWLYQTGWGANLNWTLPTERPEFRCLKSKQFGEDTTIIPFVVGQDFHPELPPGSCSGTAN